MNYDAWLTTPPDTDTCTEEPLTCSCPDCREWRENRDMPEPDDQPVTINELYDSAVREREGWR